LPLPGWNYYRLRELDRDGKIVFFPVKSLKFESTELKPFLVYPNPVVDGMLNLFLNEEGDYSLSIKDLQGRQVMEKPINNALSFNQILLPGNIKTGVYLLTLVRGKKAYAEKIFIQR
ncbi:MAG TPA: T9SS type A sorting domain-containing protein, partial [Chitinophagaceae bacterium]|nr:T9SS type A sorting domain-containing protein [Chitinophagaceae bacterium]